MLQFSDQVFIAVCTFAASLAVAALNNWHQTKLLKLEHQLRQQQSDKERKQQSLDRYLTVSGSCFRQTVTYELQAELGSATSAATPFVSSEPLRQQMFEFLGRMVNFYEPTPEDSALLAQITEGIRKELTE